MHMQMDADTGRRRGLLRVRELPLGAYVVCPKLSTYSISKEASSPATARCRAAPRSTHLDALGWGRITCSVYGLPATGEPCSETLTWNAPDTGTRYSQMYEPSARSCTRVVTSAQPRIATTKGSPPVASRWPLASHASI